MVLSIKSISFLEINIKRVPTDGTLYKIKKRAGQFWYIFTMPCAHKNIFYQSILLFWSQNAIQGSPVVLLIKCDAGIPCCFIYKI